MKNIKNEERMLNRVLGKSKKSDENSRFDAYAARLDEINEFKRNIGATDTISIDQEENARVLFEKIALLLNTGFDYYFVSPDPEVIREDETMEGKPTAFDALVNEEQFDKLRTIIRSFKDLDFIGYVESEEDKYAIWLKGTPIYVNVVPFARTIDDDIAMDAKDGEFQLFSKGELDSLLQTTTEEYKGISYKSLSIK